MKKYQKAELIAKNLPTGSYAAGCPTNGRYMGRQGDWDMWLSSDGTRYTERHCYACEIAK